MDFSLPCESTMSGMPAEIRRMIIRYAMPKRPTTLNENLVLAQPGSSCGNLLLVNKAFYCEAYNQLHRRTELTVLIDTARVHPKLRAATKAGMLYSLVPRWVDRPVDSPFLHFSRIHLDFA
jgi:hypothetical protein